MAETTTASRSPASRAALIRLATARIRSRSATEVPPNFCTTRAKAPISEPGEARDRDPLAITVPDAGAPDGAQPLANRRLAST